MQQNLSSESSAARITSVIQSIVDEKDQGWKYAVVWLGHLHTAASASVGSHLKMYRLEAMCEPDEWSSEHRWNADPCYHIFVLNEDGRPVEDHTFYFKD
jgi:hypothetical protein